MQPGTRVSKPWGYEDIFALTDCYCGKMLFIKKGHRLSLQYHKVKLETLWMMTGTANFFLQHAKDDLEGETWTFTSGNFVTIEPGTIHRITALEDTYLIEVSTPELDDVVRLEDDYHRAAIN